MNSSPNLNWYLVIIDDPEFLRGQSIFEILKFLSNIDKFKFTILYDIFGFAQNGLMINLQEKENTVISLQEFLNVVCKVRQFEWGDFFLFKRKPIGWDNPDDRFYPNLVAQTDTTVRAVDNQYIYIYTPSNEIVDRIKEKYKIESITYNILTELDYPY